MKKFGYVYHTFCKVSKKHYIGKHQGSKFDPFYFGSGKILRLAILKHGEDAFEITPIKWVGSLDELNLEEIWQIARFTKRYGKKMMYNICPGGEGFTGKHSEESKKKISRSSRGVNTWSKNSHPSKETIRKISEAHKGRFVSESTRIKISKALKGRIISDITRRNMSSAAKSRGTNWLCVQRMAEVNRGKTRSKETRRKISLAHTGKRHSTTTLKKLRIAHTGVPLSIKHRSRIGAGSRKRSMRCVQVIKED